MASAPTMLVRWQGQQATFGGVDATWTIVQVVDAHTNVLDPATRAVAHDQTCRADIVDTPTAARVKG